MKKLFSLLLAATILVLCLCSCGTETAETANEAEEGVEVDQRQIYYDAVDKTFSQSHLKYDAYVTNKVTNPDGEDITEKSIHVEKASDDWYALFNDSKGIHEFFYWNGYTYSNESGGRYKAVMTESEFCDYIESYVYTAAGAEFINITAVQNDDGTYTVSLEGMTDILAALAKHFQNLGMTNVLPLKTAGTAEIDENGYIISQVITAEFEMAVDGEIVQTVYEMTVNYTDVGQVFITQIPDDNKYSDVDVIDAPVLVKNAYESLIGKTYYASYRTLYSYQSEADEYSMELSYNQSVTEPEIGFEASDQTVIVYNTVRSDNTVQKSSKYRAGEYATVNNGKKQTEEMRDSSARSIYYNMLMDYEPELGIINDISFKDMGEYYEAEYKYTAESAILYCQNVLTALIEDQQGIAVHSEAYTIDCAVGTMKIDKASGAVVAHEITVRASFNEGEEAFTVELEHEMKVSDTVSLEVKDAEASPGETVEVDIYLENNPGVGLINAELDYDESVFTLVSVDAEFDYLLQGTLNTQIVDDKVQPFGTWLNGENVHTSGKVMTFTFTVSENAEAGDYIISLHNNEDNLMKIVNDELENVEADYLSGTITVH